MRLDSTGKASLGHIYTQPDPRPYFTALRPLDYCIPQLARPHFARLVEEYREAQGTAVPQILDVGASYGINAALLRCGVDMEELYARYDTGDPEAPSPVAHLDRDQLLARDRAFMAEHAHEERLRLVGLDASQPALDYAREAGFLHDTVLADLEADDPTPEQREKLAGTDLVVSTGCIGYVTERTLVRVIEAQGGRRPWMAHFVLRMFPFAPVDEALSALGYRTTRVGGLCRQRRFVSVQEQEGVLKAMAEAGVDPQGWETEGWMYAQLHVSRPLD